MERKIITTDDGSKTIYLPEMDENYHSGHGAYNEAMHIFIENGLRSLDKESIRIFEMGFGTGLNALLTLDETFKNSRQIDYVGIEAYPVEMEFVSQMNYTDFVSPNSIALFKELHAVEWDKTQSITPVFQFLKIHAKIEEYKIQPESIDLIYFDAFGPRAQSAMWEMSILKKMYDMLIPNGVLVTYCAQGQFKRDLKSLGFKVEGLPGPPGKREMTKAIK